MDQKRVQVRKDASDNDSATDLTHDSTASGTVARLSLGGEDGKSPDGNNDDNEESDEVRYNSHLALLLGQQAHKSFRQSASNDLDHAPENEAASISFGALAKVQELLGKRKRGHNDDGKEASQNTHRIVQVNSDFVNSEAVERKAGKKDTRDFSRSSKHAPAELSSKKAVSRKREVVPTQKTDYRDPRFEPLSGPIDDQKTKNNYSFLETYRESEISELKATIRRIKDPETKEKLTRTLLSMESRKKAQQLKNQQQEVLRKHRKEEKGKIEQGKRPFYLKKVDQKKMALVERFEGMKGKQVDKVMDRRRKKQAGKERKAMPDQRRG